MSTTVLSHASTTALSPHHSTWLGGPFSPSLTPASRSDSLSDRAKSLDVTHRVGEAEAEGARWTRARKRPEGEGVMDRNGPRVTCCAQEPPIRSQHRQHESRRM